MEYLRVYSWPNYEDRDKRARAFFDKAKAGIENLRLPTNCAFCLFSNTWKYEFGETHTDMMVLVLAESDTLPEAYSSKVKVPEAEGADIQSLDQGIAQIAAIRAQQTFVTEIQKELKAYFKSCGCPEEQELGGIDLGSRVTVDNLAARIALPRKPMVAGRRILNESFSIVEGPVIKRLKSSQQFTGQSIEEAKAAALAAISSDQNVAFEIIKEVQEKTVEVEARNIDVAIQEAKTQAPADSFDFSVGEIIHESSKGTVQFEAHSAEEAYQMCRKSAPPGASLEDPECVLAPKIGFLGIGRKPGSWKGHWSIPLRVQVSYKSPAMVIARYYETDLGKTG